MITRLSLQPAAMAAGLKQQVPSEQRQQQPQPPATGHHFHSLSPTQGEQLSSSVSISSSSLSTNTDSDSLRSMGQQQQQQQQVSARNSPLEATNNNNNLSVNNNNHANSKSPILIKYNYYDYNGARQEQTNHDMNYQAANSGAKVQRNLSPTFKQSLDQIVRSSQQVIEASSKWSGSANSPRSPHSAPASPEQQQQQQMLMLQLARRYKLSSYEQRCLRCQKTVYQMDKVGPLKDFTFYHQNCFKCRECGTKLTLKTYFNNQQSSGDHEVYCHRHCPKTGPGRLDNQSVGIRAALNAPKVFDVSHLLPNGANGEAREQSSALAQDSSSAGGPNVDSNALYIQHAVQQTRLQSIYKQSQVDRKISQFINRRLEFLEPKQKLLEMRHREEEDALFKTFEMKWRQEESCISEQIRQEWQVELGKLIEKYKRQLSGISSGGSLANGISGGANSPAQVAAATQTTATTTTTLAQNATQTPPAQAKHRIKDTKAPLGRFSHDLEAQASSGKATNELSKQQMIEFERLNLEKTMTIKLDRKKETLKRKLKEFERQATAELVEKQSREMLALISMKLDEYKEEQKRKIGSDLEQFEAMESLANQLNSSVQLCARNIRLEASNDLKASPRGNGAASLAQAFVPPHQAPSNLAPETGNGRLIAPGGPLEVPAPKPPQVSKMELYNSEEPDEVFRHIDEVAINVAREDQQTFTDLVHHLTRHCLTDIEKVRAIFRWITVKNLNTMQFDSSVKPDTPLGLLRGIKNGSESYHVLFKRLCSYAGLHCVVIKGYSKSAGYQPGVKFEGNRFRNSWNAVYVAGAWRFVQCNWGARHLVSVAVMQDKNQPTNKPATLNGCPDSATAPLSAVATGHGLHHASAALVRPTAHHQHHYYQQQQPPSQSTGSNLVSPNHGRRGLQVMAGATSPGAQYVANNSGSHNNQLLAISSQGSRCLMVVAPKSSTAASPSSSITSSSSNSSGSTTNSTAYFANNGILQQAQKVPPGYQQTHHHHYHHHHQQQHHRQSSPISQQQQHHHRSITTSTGQSAPQATMATSVKQSSNDSLRYEYDDHYFLTDPDEFIYEFYPLMPEWQLIKTRPITLSEFEQLPFVRSLFFKYGLYFPQHDIRSVLYTDSSGATTIKIGMPTHMIPSLIFHYNLKYYHSDSEFHDGVSLKRFVMQSVESGTSDSSNGHVLISNIVTFRVHLPENGAYILDIFANSTTPTQYITGEPMKFKSVCKFKIIAKNLKTCMIPLPDCASGEYGPMKATRLFGIIPITHESGLISVQNEKRFLEIQFRMTRPLLDFMASLHKNGYDERQLSKSIKIFIDGDIAFVTVKFFEDGQYGLDIYTRDHIISQSTTSSSSNIDAVQNKSDPSLLHVSRPKLDAGPVAPNLVVEPKKQLLTHCCKYLINVKSPNNRQ